MTQEIDFKNYKFKIYVSLDITAFFDIECVYNLYRISVQNCKLCAPAAATRATNVETQGVSPGLPLAVNGGCTLPVHGLPLAINGGHPYKRCRDSDAFIE